MSDKKISELTALTAPDGAEELVVNDSGTSKKITQTNLLSTALPKAGGTMTGTIAGFTSTGIDDNATSTAITIDASEKVGINETTPDTPLHVKTVGNGAAGVYTGTLENPTQIAANAFGLNIHYSGNAAQWTSGTGGNFIKCADDTDKFVVAGDGSATFAGTITANLTYNNDTPAFITNTLASGAIIERGSNANGEYTKYADGTMTCHQELATGVMSSSFNNRKGSTSGVMYRSSAGWTFPAAFVAAPRAVATSPIGGAGFTEFAAASTTAVTVYPYTDVSGNSATVNIIALGRWK